MLVIIVKLYCLYAVLYVQYHVHFFVHWCPKTSFSCTDFNLSFLLASYIKAYIHVCTVQQQGNQLLSFWQNTLSIRNRTASNHFGWLFAKIFQQVYTVGSSDFPRSLSFMWFLFRLEILRPVYKKCFKKYWMVSILFDLLTSKKTAPSLIQVETKFLQNWAQRISKEAEFCADFNNV